MKLNDLKKIGWVTMACGHVEKIAHTIPIEEMQQQIYDKGIQCLDCTPEEYQVYTN